MTDIVERLRGSDIYDYEDAANLCAEAADEIVRLREENYALKLAAAGGEDAPGSAAMVTPAMVERWQQEMWDQINELGAERDRLRAERMPAEATDAMCEAAVAVIRQAMAGEGAPFAFPDVEHAYDIYAAMSRAALEGRNDD